MRQDTIKKKKNSFVIMLVDVSTTSGVFLAKVLDESEKMYRLKYLVYKKKGFYDYEDSVEEVEKECVCGMYDPDETEEHAGFVRVPEGGFIKKDEDEDYEPSSSESEEETSDDEEEIKDEDT
jgi:hypothetical protein